MKTAEYLVEFLIKHGVKDVFGIPGGCVLEFLYALDKRKADISAHLNYHEQSAGFAALGYAQVLGTLGVAYATKGPGVTNLVTPIADAYAESAPVFFITAHEHEIKEKGLRFAYDQEIDTVAMLAKITKYATRIDSLDQVIPEIEKAYRLTTTGRKGPVFLDFKSSLFKQEIAEDSTQEQLAQQNQAAEIDSCLKAINNLLQKSKRPIFLIGDGIRQSGIASNMRVLAEKCAIPVLSSRTSEDIMADSSVYFGYVGSHGTRYGNFVLSKADLIIAVGNRMGFPLESSSFSQALKNTKIVRIDIDETELARQIPNTINFKIDLQELFAQADSAKFQYANTKDWLSTCETIYSKLADCDVNTPTKIIAEILHDTKQKVVMTSDVGNNEFWLSRGYVLAKNTNRLLYSKSFGALGCSIGKAIGAHYSSRLSVICFIGDQGFQLNIQEIEFIKSHNLPIAIVVLNNLSSGMIRSREKIVYNAHYVHTTLKSGYSVPNIKAITEAYGLKYYNYVSDDIKMTLMEIKEPIVIEIQIDEKNDLEPSLPKGNACQDMEPKIEKSLYNELNGL